MSEKDAMHHDYNEGMSSWNDLRLLIEAAAYHIISYHIISCFSNEREREPHLCCREALAGCKRMIPVV